MFKAYGDAVMTEAVIEKWSHDGRGITHINGKATFISEGIPEETVTFAYDRKRKDYDEGHVVAILQAASSRVEPGCPHFNQCGGCQLQYLDPAAQVHAKQTWVKDILTRIGHVTPENWLPPIEGPYWHYRHKARLSVRFVEKKQKTLVGFREKQNPRYIADIETCSVLHTKVAEHIPTLKNLIDSLQEPKGIAQIEVAASEEAVALIFRHLSPLQPSDLDKLIAFAQQHDFHILLQPQGPDSIVPLYPAVLSELSYRLDDFSLVFQFHPVDFTQVNPLVNQKMVKQAVDLLALTKDDQVLDLFCGLGNFSLPLATRAKNVIGIEVSDGMVKRAKQNAELNGLSNVQFYAANLDQADPIQKTSITKVLLDPPRTGAAMCIQQMAQFSPEKIVYVSCNPLTLARDADVLVNEQGYRLTQVGVINMFPHTTHVEVMALFERN
jgi:23S rRNA (uracil1939-C5)-methyltransferase